MSTYRILYRHESRQSFVPSHLGRNTYSAHSFSEALDQHLIAIGIQITRPYQFLVQDTGTLAARVFRIPAIVRAEEF